MNNQTIYNRKGLFILIIILIVAVLIQAQNMFQYPYYQDTEGLLTANSWALTTKGTLSPYTYGYEDAPLGTFLLTAWTQITGSLNTFGFALNSGRVFMLMLHLMTVALLYGITKKLTKSDLAAVIASVIFVFSPLAVILQRRILLENMMIIWLLWAFYLILGDKRKLMSYILSALCFGAAVLTKGYALFFAPAFIYAIHLRADAHHKRFANTLWIVLAAMLIAFYPLYAQMKQELFPQGWLLGGSFQHVSLLERLVDRGPANGRFLNIGSGLRVSFAAWTNLSNQAADPLLIYGGLICLLFVVVLAIDNRELRPLVAMLVMGMVYLLFGGQVFETAAITFLPFLVSCIAIVAIAVIHLINAHTSGFIRFATVAVVLAIVLYPFGIFDATRISLYTIDQVDGQLAAINWVRDHVPSTATVVTDNYAFVDLRGSNANTQYYWKLDTDPAVKFNIFQDDPCRVDYVLSTPQINSDISVFKLDLMRRVMDKSHILISYPNNGWPIEIRQVDKSNCPAAKPAVTDKQAPSSAS